MTHKSTVALFAFSLSLVVPGFALDKQDKKDDPPPIVIKRHRQPQMERRFCRPSAMRRRRGRHRAKCLAIFSLSETSS